MREPRPNPKSQIPNPVREVPEGWEGWDQYAPFYDWENARTHGRRDVPFWRRVARGADGRVLELGCGTGRVSLALAKAGVDLVGVDRSARMLDRAQRKQDGIRRIPRIPNPRPSLASGVCELRPGSPKRRRREGGESQIPPRFVRADIRALPFPSRAFAMAIAPYGVLQSLLRDRDLAATLRSVARVLRPGAIFGIDLVPDVPNWREYCDRVQLSGRAAGGAHLTLVESVRQDPRRCLTTFEQRYVERRGGRLTEHRFELTFRTLSVRQMTSRLERAGFSVDAVLGDYRGRPWDERADVWIMLARRKGR